MLNNKIRAEIRKIWDALWAGGIANPLSCMEQISYFLFMRRLSVMDEKARGDAEFLNREHASIFEGHDECRWSTFRHLPGDEMLKEVRDVVFPWIKNTLSGQGDQFAKAMGDAVFIIPRGSLMVTMVNTIDRIYELIEVEERAGQSFEDVQGDIYEEFLSEIATAGKNGQFRTPRHIIQMMAAMTDPKLGDVFCDPAAGTGGFMLGAYQNVLAANTSKELKTSDRFGISHGTKGDKITDKKKWDVLRNHSFYGYDFDTTMVRIGVMNLMVHGLTNPRLSYADTMSKSFTEAGKYDVVMANPPFKGSIDKGDIWEGARLSTTKTELLFVDRIIQLLKPGGRAAVIVPDGVLFGSSKAHKKLRKMLVEQCGLQAMVSLPSGVFKPYAGVSTGILFFTKDDVTDKVWFYDMQADGFSLDDKRVEVDECDIPDVLEKWASLDPDGENDRTSKAFFVDRSEIVSNDYDLSLNRYKEIVYEPIEYDPPLEIIRQLKEIESKIMSDLDELENMLEERE
jgi:type I restriction enzyme M protein